MKRALLFILCLLLLPLRAAAADVLPQTIKIGLFFEQTALDNVELFAQGGFLLLDGDTQEEIRTVDDRTSIEIKKSESGYSSDFGFTYNEWALIIKPLEGFVSVNNKPYRGYILLLRQEGSDITVINVVDLEEYLYSVVGKEMPPSWPIEALKAQAVCARNYAIANMGKYKKYNFDLCCTTASQVYEGVSAEKESTIRAVDETRGKVAKYQGKIVPLYYFSSSGGATEAAKNVWGVDVPYLQSVSDEYENVSTVTKGVWSVELSAEEIEQKLLAKNIDIGKLESIEVIERSESDRVIKLLLKGSKAEKLLEKDNIRAVLGYFAVPSLNFTLTPVGGSGGRSFVKAMAAPATGKNAFLPFSVYGLCPEVKNPKSYILSGKGYGHGVGMSQWGAKGMAENGFGYIDILKHYFSGIEIE